MNWKTWVPLIIAVILGLIAAKVGRDVQATKVCLNKAYRRRCGIAEVDGEVEKIRSQAACNSKRVDQLFLRQAHRSADACDRSDRPQDGGRMETRLVNAGRCDTT